MKKIIIVTNKTTGEILPYNVLSTFVEAFPQYKEKPYPSRFEELLSRKKIPFEDAFFKIERKDIIR